MHTHIRRSKALASAVQQLWPFVFTALIHIVIITGLLTASRELYYRTIALSVESLPRMRLVEALAALCQIAALSVAYCAALRDYRASLVWRCVSFVAADTAPPRRASTTSDADLPSGSAFFKDARSRLSSASVTKVEMDMSASVFLGRSVTRVPQSHTHGRRCATLAKRAFAVVSHPVTPVLLFSCAALCMHIAARNEYLLEPHPRSQQTRLVINSLTFSLAAVSVSAILFVLVFLCRVAHPLIGLLRPIIVVAALVVGVVVLLALALFSQAVNPYFHLHNVRRLSVRVLNVGVLGTGQDFCRSVGSQLKRNIAEETLFPHWELSQIQRVAKFDGACATPRNHAILSFLDRSTDRLVVSARCWDTQQQPRVFLERPNAAKLLHQGTQLGPAYIRYVEEKYGTDAKAQAAHVIVRRNNATGHIAEVEVDPQWLQPVARAAPALGTHEAAVRAHWAVADRAIEVPLGSSASYCVRCPDVDATYDETYLYPLTPGARGLSNVSDTYRPRTERKSANDAPRIGLDEPPGSVLFLLIDAVSRQEAVRSLPNFVQWMRDFRDRQARPFGGGFIVAEPLVHTTVGFNSAENIPPFLCGATRALLVDTFGADRTKTRPQAPNENIFYEFKSRYGETVETTLTSAACLDEMSPLCDTPPLPGSGQAAYAGGIDRHLYSPFCDDEYGGTLFGPQRRCFDGREPQYYAYDYVNDLLEQRKRLAKGNASFPQYFFDIAYFVEGHEYTGKVISYTDKGLTAFMEELETKRRFFDNPRNTVIVGSDHGLHYGFYKDSTQLGELERSTPLMTFMFHPEMMNRVDRMKGRRQGTSRRNFLRRLKGFNSQLDLHMTLRDILGIHDIGLRLYENNTVVPASYFDARDVVPKTCGDYQGPKLKPAPCLLRYCGK